MSRMRLSQWFDDLFGVQVKYQELADRIAMTLAKKARLLEVLDHPEVPLHNNTSELAARQRAQA